MEGRQQPRQGWNRRPPLLYLISKHIAVLSLARLLNGLGNSAAAQPAMTAVVPDIFGRADFLPGDYPENGSLIQRS